MTATCDEPPEDCKELSLWSERILVALPKDHVLAKRDVLYWTDLRDDVVLLSTYDPGQVIQTLLHAKRRQIARESNIMTSVEAQSKPWSAWSWV